MLAKRIIPCLDVKEGRVVKGTNFIGLRDAGDPVELAQRYNADGADELVFLDITASNERRDILKKLVRRVATEIDIPFTVGGGIKSVEDVRIILRNGADKTSINTAAVKNPTLISKIAKIFGSQCIVAAIDVKRNYHLDQEKTILQTKEGPCWFEVYIYGGRTPTGIDVVKWAKKLATLGAGELLITSMDRDGTKLGYDNELYYFISNSINIPLIASGGAGKPEHFLEAFKIGEVDAALAASVFHFDNYPIPFVKKFLKSKGVLVRF